MFRKAYQRGMLTIFFGGGSAPLKMWDVFTQDGCISRFLDPDINAMVLEITGTNVSTCYMTCPKGKEFLGISMPFLVMIVKNLKKYFTFEVTILDETGTRRRFRVSNFQSTTTILPLCTAMPIGLSSGWNQIQFNLAEFTRRAYKKQYVETQKVRINANIRIRRIYFAERLYTEEELPPAYKLYFPLGRGKRKLPMRPGDKKGEEPLPAMPPLPVEAVAQAVAEVAAVAAAETTEVAEAKVEVASMKVEICICPDDTAEAGTGPETLTAADCVCEAEVVQTSVQTAAPSPPQSAAETAPDAAEASGN